MFPGDDHKNRSVWRAYLPHARYVLGSMFMEDGVKEKAKLLWKFGMCLYGDGRYNEAEKSFFQVMEIRKRVLGAEHPDTLISMANLAFTWESQGRDHDALELMKACHLLQKLKLGADHPDTVASLEALNEWESLSKVLASVSRVRHIDGLPIAVRTASCNRRHEDNRSLSGERAEDEGSTLEKNERA
jgi:hypothetical protein